MCISFAVIGSLAAASVSWERLVAIVVIYGLALGIAAHAADGIGSKKAKPWGSFFSRKQLLVLSASSLAAAYSIGAYYIIFFAPLLAPIAVMEGFFLLAYNFELFGGRFHNDFWFSLSWGSLPAVAGYVMQTNSIDILPLFISLATGLVSFVEIRLSRPYKEMKRNGVRDNRVRRLENGLKSLSIGTIVVAAILIVVRIIFS